MKKKRPSRYKKYGSGPAVVIVPGLDGVTEFFSDIVPELTREFTVIVYHLPLLAEAREVGERYSFDFISADLKSVLAEIGVSKAHIIGESFGGVVTQVFALNYPETVRKLVLISTAPHFEISAKNRFQMLFLPLATQPVFARVHVYDVCERTDPRWAKEKFIREASWADRESVHARIKIVSRVDLRQRIGGIRAPTLLVVGGADRFTGEASRKMCDSLPDARTVEIPGGGHLCHMTHPERFVKETREFLGR